MMRRTETPEGRSVRLLRVGEQVRHVLSELLQRGDVHDDVLQTHVVSITEVRMSPDLRHATVFVKPLLGQDEEAVPVKAILFVTDALDDSAHRFLDLFADTGRPIAILIHDVLPADFAGQNDSIGGRHGLAGDTRLGVLRQEQVDDRIGNLVGDLVGVAFGNRFGSEQVRAAHK
jgi:ribosome-binding factor A